MWRLPGMAHSARSAALRMSRTVTGWGSASIARSSSTSMVGLGSWRVTGCLLLRVSSKDQHVGRFSTATGEVGWRGEGGVLPLQIGLRDPTGLRAAPSDEDVDTFLLNLRHQLPQRRQAQRGQGLDVRVLDQHGRIAGQVDFGLDAGLGGAIDGEMKGDAGLGRIVGSVRADVDQLGHGDSSCDELTGTGSTGNVSKVTSTHRR